MRGCFARPDQGLPDRARGIDQSEGALGAGLPVSFLFRKITRAQLARLWLEKYYPATPSPATGTGN